MTNPTPHGQVPEALIDLIDAYAETRHRCGGIYNAKTEAARKAVIEALSGVQALSAAPAGWKLVPVEPDISMQIAAKKADMDHSPLPDWLVSDWPEFLRIWHAMLAASPTPPAPQQAAPKAAPTRTALPEGWTDCTIEFGNDGPEVVAYGPKRMMTRLAKWLGKYFAQVIAEAAPKAAPGAQNTVPAEWLEQAYREGWAACRDAETIGEEAEDWAFGNSTANSRMIDAQQAAPQQEVQEPCPTCAALARTVMLDQVSFDRKPDCYGIRQITDDEAVEEWEDIRTSPDVAREEANDMMATGRGEIYEVVPLWTTPQPAPAPLSDDAERDAAFEAVRKKLCALPRFSFLSDGYGVRRVPDKSGSWIAFDAAHELFDPVAVDAALAAQGGK